MERNTARRGLHGLLAAVLGLGLTAALPAPMQAARQEASEARQTDEEATILRLVNAERAQRRLPTLRFDLVLTRAARDHSREMRDLGYFDHQSPTPGRRMPMDRYIRASGRGRGTVLVGENIFHASSVMPERAHSAFMRSPGHRENVLDGRFRRCGIGVHIAPDGRFWVTEMFASEHTAPGEESELD